MFEVEDMKWSILNYVYDIHIYSISCPPSLPIYIYIYIYYILNIIHFIDIIEYVKGRVNYRIRGLNEVLT